MAVDFLTAEQKAQYGQFSGEPNEIQLARYFHLDEADLVILPFIKQSINRSFVSVLSTYP